MQFEVSTDVGPEGTDGAAIIYRKLYRHYNENGGPQLHSKGGVLDVFDFSDQFYEGSDARNELVRTILIESAAIDGLILGLISETHRDDREIVLAAVRQNGNSIRLASPCLRDDFHIVLAAVNETPTALRFADSRLRDNSVIVRAAVRKDGLSLRYASKELRNTPEIWRVAVNQDVTALRFAKTNFYSRLRLFLEIYLDATDLLKLTMKKFRGHAEEFLGNSDKLYKPRSWAKIKTIVKDHARSVLQGYFRKRHLRSAKRRLTM
jgi:hypothetical protein